MDSNRNPHAVDARSRPSPAVSQAAVILRLLARSREQLGVTAIARRTGISQSSCFNILKTLVHEGLVGFDSERKQYDIGLGVLQLARGVLGADAILRAAMPMMNALSSQYEVTVGLWRADGKRRLTLVALGENTASTRIHMESGQRQPLGAGAAGRAWLSASDFSLDERKALFAEVRWQRLISFEAYEASIAAASACGFAEDRELVNRGIVTLASPIRGNIGARGPLHVLSASTFAGNTDPASRVALGQAIALAADRLGNGTLRSLQFDTEPTSRPGG